MPVYCDECTKELPLNDEVFSDTGGAICRDCKGRSSSKKAMAMMFSYPESEKYDDQSELLTDMLADLLHYMGRHGLDHASIIASARMHYYAEEGQTLGQERETILRNIIDAQDVAITALERGSYGAAANAKQMASKARDRLAKINGGTK